jgi:dolichol-phosphate mannosyltransferase
MMAKDRSAPTVSVVLPVYNERQNLEALVLRLVPVLEKAVSGSFEILFIDDGSRDGSGDMLDRFYDRDPRLKTIHFSRNFGHQAALQAGLAEATGKAVILMDSDLQDPPELLEQFVEKWKQNFDVVYAVRKKRKEGVFKRACYSAFYRTMRAIAEIDVPLDAGDFCLMDRCVVEVLISLPERNRFLRGLRSWVGFRQAPIEYERDPRYAGEPKYTLRKLIRLAFSGYVGFSAVPLRTAAWLGVLSATGGFLLIVWAVTAKLRGVPIPQGWASTVALILFSGGVQLLMLGVIGEYLSRVYDEVRQRPHYIVCSRTGIEPEKATETKTGVKRHAAS